jgi:hypothetical protein
VKAIPGMMAFPGTNFNRDDEVFALYKKEKYHFWLK